ncbi:MAG: MarP family serine protease [Acidimicrobiales bacterium]
MNLLDLFLVVAGALAVAGGFRIGLVTRAASWVGLLIGFFVGARLIPVGLRVAGAPGPSGTLIVAAVILVVCAFAGHAVGLIVGHSARSAMSDGRLRNADRVAGATAGGLSVLISLWLLLPVMGALPGWPARLTETSTAARGIERVFPAAPDTASALRTFVSNAGFQVFIDASKAPIAGDPPLTTGMTPEVESATAAATVKILADGGDCNRIQEGSGFVVEDNVVVTNAHVIAGERRITVQRPDGRRLLARVVVFDPVRDLAVLHVDELRQPTLDRSTGDVGAVGAVLGHPRGQQVVRAAPARVSREVLADGRDIYNRDLSRRQIFVLAADLQQGDSGGPLVDASGKVIGVAFAIAPQSPSTAYALTGAELEAVLEVHNADRSAEVETGACVP